ncbi:MAG: FAD binding domain-containing protein [Clostridiales bacterium]|nr:FAD binding domain-containing protein [Clostridiales bacterium]
MIMRFRPEDFEECLMSLPIDNWLFVDTEKYYNSEESSELLRPKMLISHLSELKGIQVNGQVVINAFTDFIDIFNTETLSSTFRIILEKAQNMSVKRYQTLGCHLMNHKNDPILFPYLVAIDAKILLKSYIKERTINFRAYTFNEHKSMNRYNELFYKLWFENIDFDTFKSDIVTFEKSDFRMTFSYFIGMTYNKGNITSFRYALMLPSKRVMRCDAFESLFLGQSLEFNDQLKTKMRKIFYDEIKRHRLTINHKIYSEGIFEELIWKVVYDLIERSRNDEKGKNQTSY